MSQKVQVTMADGRDVGFYETAVSWDVNSNGVLGVHDDQGTTIAHFNARHWAYVTLVPTA